MKVLNIFLRDLKVNKRDFISLYILFVPFLLAIIINLVTPSINNTTVNFAIMENETSNLSIYLDDFASLEYFDSVEEIEKRVNRRDDVFGIVKDNGDFSLISEGNELKGNEQLAKTLLTLFEENIDKNETNATLIDFGETASPIRKLLVNMMIMLISVLGGMLIAINIVEEKVDNTLSAINVTPISRLGYVFGKSLIGLLIPLYGSLVLIYLTGFSNINVLQILTIVLVSSLLSLIIGFSQGLQNKDVMSAAANMKVLFLPMYASIAAVELLGDFWQKFFYISPFYWSYKANKVVLEGTASWGQIGFYSLITFIIIGVIYLALIPKIRKGLE